MLIERTDVVELPKSPTVPYLIMQQKRCFESCYVLLGRLESRLLRHKLRVMTVDRPIYITGLARAGTTISLELISQHEDTATHRYRDIVQPHLPFFWNRTLQPLQRLMLPHAKPLERIHKDGMLVTPDSPDAVEETVWKQFFPDLHDETHSAVLDAQTSNPAFERYYTDHIKKLLLAYKRSRYLTKANYDVTRLGYLTKLFPEARFLVLVRHPAAHLASWVKQDQIFTRLFAHDPRWHSLADTAGHHEFGPGSTFINAGDTARVREIREYWDRGMTARAFGMYWASVYGHILDLMASNAQVRKATMLVHYEDLCAEPVETIDKMLAHAALDPAGLGRSRDHYLERVKAPHYYTATLNNAECRDIAETTGQVAASLGYDAEDIGTAPSPTSSVVKTLNRF
jgi:hypothetical protein